MTNNPHIKPLPYPNWTPTSWKSTNFTPPYTYQDPQALKAATDRLAQLPPLVTSGEIEKLKIQIEEAQQGKRFILQGGDCAETLDECRPEYITNKLKILLQMSLVLIHGLALPVTRIGRFAGQYAKPRSSPTETATHNGQQTTLPSYFGDLINRAPFTPQDRQPDPNLLVEGYKHASMTLNFIRSLLDGGFADLHHPEYWDLTFFNNADLDKDRKTQYQQMSKTLADGLAFMENLGEKQVHESTRVDFYTSHEGLNLHYEQAQTRTVPRKQGHFDLTTHLPWIGERNRNLDGPHIEFFKGINNPVGIKVGPTMNPNELEKLINTLNPTNEPGKIVLI
ncbi:MAG: 3-deoxy-7-phosphoheptulonate synthase, partial [Phycisphaerales bacterium]|nr:3-deoxy-7-phosphoheptulonate synthase [Phycisphaerales bacterium]